mgnify:FL=1
MKIWNTDNKDIEKSGMILVTDCGDVLIAEHEDVKPMMQRLVPDVKKWKTEMVECAVCGESWCEIYRKGGADTICPNPNCQSELEIR